MERKKLDEHAFKACENKSENNKSWADLAEEFGYGSSEELRGLYRREVARRLSRKNLLPEDSSLVEDSSVDTEKTSYMESDKNIYVVCSSKRIKTKEDVIKEFGIDESVWKIQSFTIKTSEGFRKDRSVEWEVSDGKVTRGSVSDSGKMLVVPMYHTKTVLVKKNQNDISLFEISKLFENISFSGPKVKRIRQEKSSSKTLEVVLTDVHVGNDSALVETKNKLDILVNEILSRINREKFKKVLLIQLGDLFHFDTYHRTTTSGTNITTSSNYFKMWESGVKMLIDFIETLSEVIPVEMVNVFGNHDMVSSFTAGKALEYYFKNNENVTIDNSHDERKYRKIGRNLIGFVHGDMPKNNVYSLLQREARKMFSETDFFEIHLGHVHHEHSYEKDGVIIRYLPTIAETDEWHRKQGYTGYKKCGVCFVWDDALGLQEQWWINLD